MASTEQLPNGRWRGIYRDASGRRRSKSFDHKRPAERWAHREEDRARRGHRTDPDGVRLPWGQWFDRWDPTRNLAESTRRAGRTRIEQHVRPRWGTVPLGAVTRLDVQRWVTTELPAAGLSAASVIHCYRELASSFAAAVDSDLLDVTPCRSIQLPTRAPGRERYLSADEQRRIVAQLDDPYRLLVELLFGTGMRLGEACGLHRARVDLDAQTVRVWEVWDVRSRTMVGYPKGKKRRTVPLDPYLTDRLADWFEQRPARGACGQHHPDVRCPGPLLLTGPGRWAPGTAPVDPHNFTNRVWPTVLAGTASDDVPAVEHCVPHDLRHTYASRLVQAGVHLTRVRDLLGHASITTTERYAHLVPDQFDAVRAALAAGPQGTVYTGHKGQDHGTSHGTPTDPATLDQPGPDVRPSAG